ncbi:MlaD family protein [Mucilaginibacter sp. UR6-11]|uniref:MlaD family protein n=1 Tax=Mucilaginibacter sp. UR6-11 TaxID=1435644 RepID=UPI001E40E450|nr:MlaD family protein [Mucilaginibacter sp. UR6-11]MCC8424571.1 MlaD family protein [Mucilaginibacter sp. UR6-11]
MKTTSSQKIKIGLFTFIGLLVLIAAIFFIGNQKSLFSSTVKINGIFNNVNGLQVGNNVRLAGINVGVVDDIQILNDTSVKVTLMVDDDVKKFIKKDSKMNIGSDGLMGDKLVVLMPGGANTSETIKDGDRIGAVNPVDVDKIIGKFTKMADNAGTLIDNLSQIVAKVNTGKGSLGRLLNNDKMAREMESTVAQAKTTMQNVHKTTSTLNEDLKAAQGNFLLKGFFNKKKKAAKAKQDSIKKVQEKATKDAGKQ